MSKTLFFIIIYHITFLFCALYFLDLSFSLLSYSFLCYLTLFAGYVFPRKLKAQPSLYLRESNYVKSTFDSHFLVISIIGLSGLFLFALKLMISLDDLSLFRMQAFGTSDNPSVIYGSQLNAMIFNNVIFVVSYVNLAVGVRKTIQTKNVFYFFLYSVPLVLSGLIMFDRGWIYILVLSYVYIILNKKDTLKWSTFRNFSFGVTGAVVVTLLVSFLRGDDLANVFNYMLRINLLGYNIIGYQLMEDFLGYLTVNFTSGYGRYTFGGMENIFYLLLRLGDVKTEIHGARLVEFFQLSYTSWSDVNYNAFFTIFTPLLLDFGYLGGFIFFFTMGLLYKVVGSSSSIPMQHLKFVLYLMFISFNQKPFLASMGFTFVFVLFVVQQLYIKFKT